MGLKRYAYRGVRRDGVHCRGDVVAYDRDQATRSLLYDGVTITSMTEHELPAVVGDDQMTLSGERLALLYRQLFTMYQAGISLERSFRLLSKGADTATPAPVTNDRGELKVRARLANEKVSTEARLCLGMAEALTRGLKTSQAMSMYPKVFGPPHIAMVAVGETGGIMPRILEELSTLTERSDSLRKKVRSSTTYPIFILVTSVACVFGLFNYVMPQFLDLVREMNITLPLHTRLLIFVAQVIRHPVTLTLGALLIFLWSRIWKRLRERQQLQHLLDTGSTRAIIFGQVTLKVSLARGMQILAALSNAGVNLRESLPMAAKACGNRVVGDALEAVAQQVMLGVRMADAMKVHRKVFPPALVAYVESGEVAGQLPEMLVRASHIMTIDADAALDVLPELLEPLIIAFLGFVVGAIVLSVFVPLYAALKTI